MTKKSDARWNEQRVRSIVAKSRSVRQVLQQLGLREAGGNYRQFARYAELYQLDIQHFTGKGSNRGIKIPREPVRQISEILQLNSFAAPRNLKRRLFKEGLKKQECEECGWAKVSPDGRLPVEMDHINGDPLDTRLENLRILCPNCHSLKPTHRGSNIKKRRRGGEIGIHATLKT
ncbi:HNH endonuclease, partial [Patescibacteria group bacterium]|nr:HNH endonuclease [Patescibacteria group bacterium]